MAFKFTHDDINKLRAQALQPLQPNVAQGNGGGLRAYLRQVRLEGGIKGERNGARTQPRIPVV